MSKTNNNDKVYINHEGNRVMRVSEVIKILAKDQLIFWANMLGFKKISYRQELDRTANIGSLVHAVLEDYVNPKRISVIDYDQYNVTEYGDKIEVTRALQSFFKWHQDLKKIGKEYIVKFTELVVVGNELGGTIDCGIQGFNDPNKVIFVDYKTSSSIYLTMFLQLAAYVMIYEEVYGKNTVEGIMVVQMDKKYGDAANARFVSRERLDIFISAFRSMFVMAKNINLLTDCYWELTEKIG